MSTIENDYRDDHHDEDTHDEMEHNRDEPPEMPETIGRSKAAGSEDDEYEWETDDQVTDENWDESVPVKEGKTIMGYSVPVFAGIVGGILVAAGGFTFFMAHKGAPQQAPASPIINQPTAQQQPQAPMVRPVEPVNINVSAAPAKPVQAPAKPVQAPAKPVQAPAQAPTQVPVKTPTVAPIQVKTEPVTQTVAPAAAMETTPQPVVTAPVQAPVGQVATIQPVSIPNHEFREQVKSNMNQLSQQVGKTSAEVGQLSARMDSGDQKMVAMDAKLDEILKKVSEVGRAGGASHRVHVEKQKPASPIKGWKVVGYSSNGTAVLSTGSGVYTVKEGFKIGEVVIKSVSNGAVYTNHGVVR